MNSSRIELEIIMREQPGKALTHDQFRIAVNDFYNFTLKPGDLSGEEMKALKDLFDVIIWYSPLPTERQKIPHYRDEKDVERAWAKARTVLRFPTADYLHHFKVQRPTEAAALWKLRLVEASRLPSIAAALLVKGYDTPPLRRLAAEESDSLADLGRMFDQVLDTLGGEPFESERSAAVWLIPEIASRIAEGTVEAYPGARVIWKISLVDGVGSLKEADPFIYCASEWEDRMDDREFFARSIVEAARRLVSKET
jgi:hypothetical protein